MKKIFTILLIFVFSLIIRLSTLNEMGRTWDEGTYVSWGYNLVNLAKNGDFSNPYWYANPGFPPVSRYVYGIASYFDVNRYDSKGDPVFNYDLTFTRLVSAILTSLTAVMIILLGWKYFSPLVGALGGMIFAMLPLSVAYGQIATLESFILFFFTGTVMYFFNFLSDFSKKNIILTGIFLGLALGVKYTNFLLFPLLILLLVNWFVHNDKNRDYFKAVKAILSIFAIALLTFFVIWPMPFFHIREVIEYNYSLRVATNKYPSVEVFFGRVMHVPVFYFFVQFLITAPIFALSVFFIGAKRISDLAKNKLPVKKFPFLNRKENKWILYALIFWFCFPFIQSFYNLRVQGIRYIIEIYAPFSLICAIGLDYFSSLITKDTFKKSVILIIFFLYLLIVLIRISPYFLDYYNFAVGGAEGVNKKHLFQVGWWGQGIKEAGLYVEKNAFKGTKVGLAVDPIESMPPSKKIISSKYTDKNMYDYVLVSDFFIIRLGFDDSYIKKNYNLVYSVRADGASLVYVYKKK